VNTQLNFYPAGDRSIQIDLGDKVCPEINLEVRKIFLALKSIDLKGITECVPTYCTLSVYYDPLVISYGELLEKLKAVCQNTENLELPIPYVAEIPTCYDHEFGLDWDFITKHCNLSKDEIINIHSGTDYLIYMLGFTPGYCYLGGMSEKIAAPRLVKPRTHVPAGSVGIAGTQTGIYPIESPGGWQILGRTPVELFNPTRTEDPILLEAGNYVRFVPINMDEYNALQRDIKGNRYTIRKSFYKEDMTI
jgi:KipI family sensor histidine kinase inhibitor